MNIILKAGCRMVQKIFRMAIPILPYRKPELLDSVSDISQILIKKKISSILLVTDEGLRKSGCTASLEAQLEGKGIVTTVYDKTQANPTVHNAEEAKSLYLEKKCQAIIAFGGGSSMDCAKAAGALLAYPKKSARQLGGLLKVWRKLPTLIAVPTTAGTGSEVTITAVITDSEKKHKYTMNSFPLMPHYAVLDPAVTLSLPPHLTAATGMDALTHAVEAYIGGSTTKETRTHALDAVRLIFENLPKVYADGSDIQARKMMLVASYKAGVAFSKSYVGYVHAVAHSLGGQYNVPHGLANAVLLPIVLEKYGPCAYDKLYDLAIAAGVAEYTDSQEAAAQKFIRSIREMNKQMDIPVNIPQIQSADIPLMARHAAMEANPLYPVPKIMDRYELEYFYERVSSGKKAPARLEYCESKEQLYEY